jgi:RNA polymerase sigma-70 factor (ECF subfamily)
MVMDQDRWQVSDEASFLVCYRATVDRVFRYAAMLCGADRAAAEDLVQDVYLHSLARARAGTLTSVTVGYLTLAVRHRFLDRVKATQREDRRLTLVATEPVEEATMAPTWEPLAALPERERTAVVLRYVDDLSVAGVADAMGISLRAAESLLARAMHRMREGDQRHG